MSDSLRPSERRRALWSGPPGPATLRRASRALPAWREPNAVPVIMATDGAAPSMPPRRLKTAFELRGRKAALPPEGDRLVRLRSLSRARAAFLEPCGLPAPSTLSLCGRGEGGGGGGRGGRAASCRPGDERWWAPAVESRALLGSAGRPAMRMKA